MMAYTLILALSSLPALATPLVDRQSCADVTVIFARGTLEPGGSIGLLVGPPFKTALQSALGGKTLNFIGVDYPASLHGFLEGGDTQGARTMANDVISIANSCPMTSIVMSGYSQGAQLIHLAAPQLSPAVQNRVNAVVVFGDPDDGQPFPGLLNGRSITFCATGDDICAGGILFVVPPYLLYGVEDARQAAAFVAPRV